MLKCPTCGRVYENDKQAYCLNDGTALLNANPTLEPTVEYSGSLNRPPFSAPQPPIAKKSNALLILGGVGLMMFVLFIGVLLIVGLILNWKEKNDPANTANTNAQPTPVTLISTEDKYQPELKMAINSANNAQSNAYASYDTAALRNYYSGEALKSYMAEVENLKRAKIYQFSTLEGQQFEYFKVNDAATEAEVRVVETWSSTVYQTPSKKCLAYYAPTRTPQIVYLKKAQGGWMVDATVYDAGIKKTPQACPKAK